MTLGHYPPGDTASLLWSPWQFPLAWLLAPLKLVALLEILLVILGVCAQDCLGERQQKLVIRVQDSHG